MKQNEIKVGGIYAAKISGRIVPVKVLEIIKPCDPGAIGYHGTRYKVRNQNTGRDIMFRSAAKFRYEVKPKMTQAEEMKVCSDILDRAEEGAKP